MDQQSLHTTLAYIDAGSLPSHQRTLLICDHLRRLIKACDAREQHAMAAWYANKLVTLSQSQISEIEREERGGEELDAAVKQLNSDVLLLVRAYMRNNEHNRAYHTLEIHGLIDVDRLALSEIQRTRAINAAVYDPDSGSVGPATVVRPDAMEAVYIAATCLKQAKQHEKALQLLENAMEGSGLPQLLVPIRPKDDDVRDDDEDISHAVKISMAQMEFSTEADTGLPVTSGSILKKVLQGAGPDANVTWRLVKLMALYHAKASGRPLSSDPNAADAHPSTTASPVFTKAVYPTPFSDGGDLNIISALCHLRGECLILVNNRPRATQWLLAAVRTDPYNVAALQLLLDNHLLSDDEEARLSRYITAICSVQFILPLVAPGSSRKAEVPPSPRERVSSVTSAESGPAEKSDILSSPPRPSARRTDSSILQKTAHVPSSAMHKPPHIPKSPSRPEPTSRMAAAGPHKDSHETLPVDPITGPSHHAIETQHIKLDLGWLEALLKMRLNRYSVSLPVPVRFQALESEYRLGGNCDVLAAKSEALLYQHDAAASHALSRKLMTYDPHDRRVTAVHLANLVELGRSADLFQVGHAAVKGAPKDALSWHAVGCYYLSLQKAQTAIKYFVKATQVDPNHAISWMGLGRSYTMLNEHEPALQSYRAAMNILPRAHMPPLAMASIASRAGQSVIAKQYLELATARCPSDPLVYHEAGILEYQSGAYSKAWGLFAFALDLVSDCPFHVRKAWEPTMFAMGHTCRKLGQYANAINWYEKCLGVNPGSQSTLAALAFTYHLDRQFEKAVSYYHAALAQDADDGFCNALVNVAMTDHFADFGAAKVESFAITADSLAVQRAQAHARGRDSSKPDPATHAAVQVMPSIQEFHDDRMPDTPSEIQRSGLSDSMLMEESEEEEA